MLAFIIIGVGLAIGDVLMNHWADGGSRYHGSSLAIYIAAVIVYTASLTLYAYQLKTTQLSIATIIPVLINVGIVFAVSAFYLHEKVSAYQYTGIFLALMALIFLSRK